MIVVTGAAGFIGSCLVGHLNKAGHQSLILVDDFTVQTKAPNLLGKEFIAKIDREDFFEWAEENSQKITFVFHLGARTDTMSKDQNIFDRLNLQYSKAIWNYCTEANIPLVYASSAATYGDGSFGYHDDHSIIYSLKPLNLYGHSKNDFDKWALQQETTPDKWAGLKFFNVFGPNEYHKGRMASVVYHAYRQIIDSGEVKLFRSHHPDYADGQQQRDFIYINDVLSALSFFMEKSFPTGLYNIGTGIARTFNDLASAVFNSMNLPPKIQYIDTPLELREKYQYFTQAETGKLYETGFQRSLFTLEDGVEHYVRNYLSQATYF